jgi:predicted TIM-barrel fold metal-dependent hydrolase
MERLDHHYKMFGFDVPDITMAPSEYFRRQCFVSVEEVEPGLPTMVRDYPESVVFSSDYPHADGTFPGSTKDLLETTELDDDAVRRVLRDNALRLYGLAR